MKILKNKTFIYVLTFIICGIIAFIIYQFIVNGDKKDLDTDASLVDENDSIKLYVKGPGDTNRIELNSSNSNTYTRTVNYNDFKNNPNYSVTVNVYVDWLNKADGSNDEADTKIGTSGSTPKLVIPVNIVFEQVK